MRKMLAVAVALILSACSDKEPSVATPAPSKPTSVSPSMPIAASASQPAPRELTELEKREPDEIAKSDKLVERNGRTLILHFQSGKTLELANSEACEDYESCRFYTYRGLIADKQFFWVLVGFYEGGQSLLISRETGVQVDTIREPHVSPDGKFVVSVSDAEAYEDPGVFLWEIDKGALVSRFHFVPTDYQLYGFVKWADPTKVDLMRTTWPPKGDCLEHKLAEYPMALVEKNGEWKLEATSDKGRCLVN